MGEIDYRLNFGIRIDPSTKLPLIHDLKDRFSHTYILGQTGMGKSVLMERMASYDLSKGLSIIYIDPKGDSVKKLYYGAEDKNKIRYVSIDNPMTINPLQKKGYDDIVIIDEFRQIMDILVMLTTSNPESTVLMSELIEMSIRGFNHEQRNLDYFLRFLTYEKVRHSHKFTDPELSEYWEDFDAFDRNIRRNKDKIESAKRVASRLLKICRGKMKDIVIGENEFNLTEILDSGQSLLIDTSRMGDEARIYLSNLIVYGIFSYVEYNENFNYPLLVYVDEFQDCLSSLFPKLLGKARSKQVGFTIAHHDFGELHKRGLGVSLLSSVFGTTNTFIAFRCGDEEAKKMADTYGLKNRDFLDQDKFCAWIRLGNENIPVHTFPPLIKDLPEDFTPPTKDRLPGPQKYNFLRNAYIPLSDVV